MNEKLQKLTELGADDFKHISGPMIQHLIGTYNLLRSWGASTMLCDAGLFHAVYGPAGLNGGLLSISRRSEIAGVIGEQAEALVYFYCSCDKTFVLPQIGRETEIMFRDRFTSDEFWISEISLADFCELTVANELDVARGKAKEVYSSEIMDMLHRMRPLLSKKALEEVNKI